MAKQIFFDEEGRQQLERGVEKLANTLRVTLGPSGRSVLLEKKYSTSTITKDGITISKEVELAQPFENMGAKLLHEVTNRTNKEVGDGTTTAALLAERMIKEGKRFLAAGCSPIAIRSGIEHGVTAAVEALGEMAVPIKGKKAIEQVGFLASSRDREVGRLFGEAMTKVGAKGVVTVEENDGVDTVLDYVEGVEIDKGFVSPHFITNPEEGLARLEKPYLLITDHKVSSIRDLLGVLEAVLPSRRPLFIVAEDVEGEALAGLIINRLRGVLEVCAAKAPGFGDRRKAMLEDLAVCTGGTFLSKDLGFEWDSVRLDQLGSCEKIECTKDKTYIFRGTGKSADVEQRKRQIESQIEQTNSSYDREKLEERLAKLSGRIAVIRVGAFTEPELKERKQRVQDALNSTRAAMEEGIVPGGGAAFLRVIPAVEQVTARGEEKLGIEVVVNALRAPLTQIAANVGRDGPAVTAEAEELDDEFGFDAMKGTMVNLVRSGIVDAAKVLRVALQNAASIASLSLVSDTMITEIPKGERALDGAVT